MRSDRVSLLVLALGILLLTACEAPSGAGPPSLIPLPPPPVAGAERRILDRLQAQQGLVTRLLRNPDTDPLDLAWSFGRLGNLYQSTLGHNMESARICYENARRLDPQGFRWAYLLGYLEQIQGNVEASDAALAAALRLRPEDLPTRIRLAENARSRDEPAQARALLEEVLERDSAHVKALAELGKIALDRRDLQAAVQYLEAARNQQPRATEIHYALGRAHRGLGESDRARDAFALVPSNPKERIPIRYNDPLAAEIGALLGSAQDFARRARAAISQDRFGDAIGLLNRSIALDAHRADTRYNLAAVLLRTGEAGQARSLLDQLVRDFPNHVLSRVLLARLLAGRGDPDSALDHLKSALEADPRDERAHLALADLSRMQGDLAAALASYERAIALEPGLAAARFGRAITLIRSDRTGAALTDLEAAVADLPADKALRMLLARLLVTVPESGLRDADRAMELSRSLLGDDGGSVAAVETLAMVLAASDRFDEAVSWQSAARERLAGTPRGIPRHTEERLAAYRRGEATAEPWAIGERPTMLPRPAERSAGATRGP